MFVLQSLSYAHGAGPGLLYAFRASSSEPKQKKIKKYKPVGTVENGLYSVVGLQLFPYHYFPGRTPKSESLDV